MVASSTSSRTSEVEAKRWYEKAIAIDANAPVASNNLAWMTAEEGGSLDVAVKLASRRSRPAGQPLSVDGRRWAGCITRRAAATLAITSFQASVQKDPKNAIYHYHLGLAYAQNGDKDKARVALKEALTLNPTFEGAAEAQKTLATL